MIKIEEIYKKYKIYIIIIGVIILAFFIYKIYFQKSDYDLIEKYEDNIQNNIESKNSEESSFEVSNVTKKIVVHIQGAIARPGIIELNEGSRINDAINSAGGLLQNSNTDYINLAQRVEDRTKIIIPTNEEIAQMLKDNEKEINQEFIQNSSDIENSLGKEVFGTNTTQNENKKININTADIEELKTLPGIGDVLANKIINYRKNNGLFSNIEDIKNVNGIGESRFDDIKDFINV